MKSINSLNLFCAAILLICPASGTVPKGNPPQLEDSIWDIAVGGVDTVFLEEMTSGEIAKAVRSGYTSIIIATGGLEQNGPNVVTGKHNFVLRATTNAIARKHDKMLVASIVPFVPQGRIDPASGHMRFPGTISVRNSTFRALLLDICRSLRQTGFEKIFLIGDSGGNQAGMEKVAKILSDEWGFDGSQVLYIPEYYSEDLWSFAYLKQLGYTQLPDIRTALRNNIHTDLHYESILAAVDPRLVRASARFDKGSYEIHGIEFEALDELVALGQQLIDYRADITVKAMQAAVEGQSLLPASAD